MLLSVATHRVGYQFSSDLQGIDHDEVYALVEWLNTFMLTSHHLISMHGRHYAFMKACHFAVVIHYPLRELQ